MNSSSTASSRPPAPTIFIGNIPYDLPESTLVELFREIGPVKSFRLVNDRDTGMAKGYGFCEYYDTTTAESAVRNLNNHELNGRSIRVDFADEHVTKQVGSKSSSDLTRSTTGGTRDDLMNSRQKEDIWSKDQLSVGMEAIRQAACKMAFLLGGRDVVLGSTPPTAGSNLQIYAILSEMTRKEMYEILAGMKDVVQRNYGSAKTILIQNPQLLRTLFLMEIVLGIVEAPELSEEAAGYDAYRELDIHAQTNRGDTLPVSYPQLVMNPPPRPMQSMTSLEQFSNSQMPGLLTGMIQTPTMMTRNVTGMNIQLQNPQTPTYGTVSGLGFNNQETQVLPQQFTGVMPGVQMVAQTPTHQFVQGVGGSQNQIVAVNQQPSMIPQPMVSMANLENEGDASAQGFSSLSVSSQVFSAPQESNVAIGGDTLDEQTKNRLNQILSLTREQLDMLPPEHRDQALAIQRQLGKIT
eukprot:g1904.t1